MRQNPSIIYQDEDILVLEKPSGWTVNRSDTTHAEETIQDWIETNNLLSLIPPDDEERIDFYKRAGIVHRLDKETSGILLVAKNPESFVELQRQFKERIVEKTYKALVHGKVIPVEGEINVPVGRLVYNRMRFGVVAGGRESLTYYKVLQVLYKKYKGQKDWYSLVELYPKTGRTHQIRVHMKYLNYPLVSDTLYGGRKTAREDRKYLNRLFLHAGGISFLHPRTHKKISFTSNLHDELQDFLKQLDVEN